MLQSNQQSLDERLVPYLRTANVYWDGVTLENIAEMWFRPQEIIQFGLEPGDLLVCEGGDVGRATIWQAEIPVCCIQNALHRIRVRGSGCNRFLYYWLLSLKQNEFIDILCNRATLSHLTGEKLRDIPWPVPSSAELAAIVAFLDRETARIDALG